MCVRPLSSQRPARRVRLALDLRVRALPLGALRRAGGASRRTGARAVGDHLAPVDHLVHPAENACLLRQLVRHARRGAAAPVDSRRSVRARPAAPRARSYTGRAPRPSSAPLLRAWRLRVRGGLALVQAAPSGCQGGGRTRSQLVELRSRTRCRSARRASPPRPLSASSAVSGPVQRWTSPCATASSSGRGVRCRRRAGGHAHAARVPVGRRHAAAAVDPPSGGRCTMLARVAQLRASSRPPACACAPIVARLVVARARPPAAYRRPSSVAALVATPARRRCAARRA